MLRVVAVLSLCVVMFFPPLTNTLFFRWGTGTLPFPPYRFDCRPSRPPKLCSRLHKCTMFQNICQVADYINAHVSAVCQLDMFRAGEIHALSSRSEISSGNRSQRFCAREEYPPSFINS